MKELFGVNLTENKLNSVCDGEEAATRRPTDVLRKKYLLCGEAALEQTQRIRLNGLIASVRNIALLAFIGCAAVSLFMEGALKHVVGWAGVALGVCAAALTLFEMIRAAKFKRTVQMRALDRITRLNGDDASIQLGIPPKAQKIDAFVYEYKLDKGDVKICERAGVINMPTYILAGEEKITLFDGENCYDISKKAILRIDKEEVKLTSFGYSRGEKYNEELYPIKKFRMRYDDRTGKLTTRYHYKLAFTLANNEYCLRFPPYELDTIEQYTGKKYVEPTENTSAKPAQANNENKEAKN